jgi:Secretion system C-terminal sorting domain
MKKNLQKSLLTILGIVLSIYSTQAQAPTASAPTPTAAAANVISMFSNAYTNVTVDTWRTSWSNATLTDLQIVGNDTKLYSLLDFVGVETVGANMINATTMNTFNIDVWTANATTFRVKLVDFGADGAYGGGDDVEHEIPYTPTLNGWNTYNIPLVNFTNLTTKAHIAQVIFSALPTGSANVYVDNVYFSNTPIILPTAPTTAAPTPTPLATNVISMFSNAYTDVPVDTWRTSWSNATLTDLQIAGNDTKKYSALDFVGIETVGGNMIDATTMDKFNVDVWTPDATAFKVKLVDFGADAAYGGGDDVEHELTFTPTIGGWNSYHIPLSNFTGLTTRAHIAQTILVGTPAGANTIYIDNMYFSKDPVTAPMVAAPTPTPLATNVISMFSNAYTDVPVDTWRTSWSNATLTDLQIATNDTKKYSALDFVGIETVGANMIDATTMDKFNVDVWTADATAFKVKLVDFGADAAYGGGDDVEHELTFTPTIGGWNSYHIPLSNFTGLTTRAHIAQTILVGTPAGANTIYIDNMYFSKDPVTAPMVAAPTPTPLATNVISMFSNAYTDVPVDTWRTSWSNATLTDLQIATNDTKKYSALDFVGIETVGANMIDATTMDKFNVDVWTADATAFKVKLVDFGADAAYGGGDDVEHELTFTPTIGGWNSYHIPLSNFTGLTTRAHIAQTILVGTPAGANTIYIDNMYFSKDPVTAPMVAAPTPTPLVSDVISMFSNAYTDVPVDTWRTIWSNATLTDLQIASNDTKKYSALDFVGIETVNNMIDASAMNYFNVDVWTADATAFKIKLVDFGADAAYGGGDDVEHELAFTPTIGGWNSYHIPLANFTGLTTRAHIAQTILAGTPSGTSNVYIDNVYFSTSAPLSLGNISVNATLENNTALVNWITTNEKNVSFFEVEKSIDGVSFKKINEVKATNNNSQTYSIVDMNINNAKHIYYRIKTINNNATFSYSEIASIVVNSTSATIAPNPATNTVTIYTNNNKPTAAYIYSAVGQLITEVVITNSKTLDISQLATGTYFVKMQNTSTMQFSKN